MTKQFTHILLSFFIFFLGMNGHAQEVIPKAGSYLIDKENKTIVWHEKNLDSVISINKKIVSLNFGESYALNDSSKQLSYSEDNYLNNGEHYILYITRMPIINIKFDTLAINNRAKIPGFFTFFNDGDYVKSTMGVRHRGNLSLSFPKKSFDLEFWTDSIAKQKKNLKFKGMRNDDDWILDGMYNEPLRLRSFVATHLWSKIHEPYYSDKEPKVESGFDAIYVEVFKNNTYYGIYQFSESIDRKQLRIKKHEGNAIYGELYKANSYDGGPDFTKAPDSYNNLFPHWNGWKTEYPFIDFTSNWENLSNFEDLVVKGTDKDFVQNIESMVHIPNAIDYYLFVNLLRASDNLGKNYYLGKYDKGEPYFFVPWDLDGVWGIIQDGKREWVNNDILTNGLFKRLVETNPNGYKDKVKSRWTALRAKEFSNDVLFKKINKIYNRFTNEKVYEREQNTWKDNKLNKATNEDHYNHLTTWLNERLNHLDAHFLNF